MLWMGLAEEMSSNLRVAVQRPNAFRKRCPSSVLQGGRYGGILLCASSSALVCTHCGILLCSIHLNNHVLIVYYRGKCDAIAKVVLRCGSDASSRLDQPIGQRHT